MPGPCLQPCWDWVGRTEVPRPGIQSFFSLLEVTPAGGRVKPNVNTEHGFNSSNNMPPLPEVCFLWCKSSCGFIVGGSAETTWRRSQGWAREQIFTNPLCESGLQELRVGQLRSERGLAHEAEARGAWETITSVRDGSCGGLSPFLQPRLPQRAHLLLLPRCPLSPCHFPAASLPNSDLLPSHVNSPRRRLSHLLLQHLHREQFQPGVQPQLVQGDQPQRSPKNCSDQTEHPPDKDGEVPALQPHSCLQDRDPEPPPE